MVASMLASAKSLEVFLLVFAVVTVSFLSCARLLWALGTRLEPKARRRLFPRQLRSLALVGLLLSCTGFPVVWADLWYMDTRSAEWLCKWVTNGLRACRFVSALQETHLALTCLAQCMRATKLLRVLNRSILALWILGLLLGVVDAVWFPYQYDRWTEHMPWGRCSVEGDFITIGIVGLCLTTSCIASVVTFAFASNGLCGATTSSGPVQRRNFKRALWYPSISVLSYAPIMVVYAFPNLFHRTFCAAAMFFEYSNGAMNAGVYGFQSHYALRLSKSIDTNSDVSVGPGVCAGSTCPGTSDVHLNDLESAASFDVRFGEVDVVMLHLSTSSFAKFEENLPDWLDNRRLAPRLSSSF